PEPPTHHRWPPPRCCSWCRNRVRLPALGGPWFRVSGLTQRSSHQKPETRDQGLETSLLKDMCGIVVSEQARHPAGDLPLAVAPFQLPAIETDAMDADGIAAAQVHPRVAAGNGAVTRHLDHGRADLVRAAADDGLVARPAHHVTHALTAVHYPDV